MKAIVASRGIGKTTMLIQESARTGYYIVTRSRETARLIFRWALDKGLEIPFPLTYREFVGRQYSSSIGGLLIDDADYFLQWMATVPVAGITINLDMQNEPPA